MNLLLILADSPVLLALSKWTVLLTFGWAGHGLLRNGHPRWRLGLWRALLVGGVLLGLSSLVPLPGLRMPLPHWAGRGHASAPNPGADGAFAIADLPENRAPTRGVLSGSGSSTAAFSQSGVGPDANMRHTAGSDSARSGFDWLPYGVKFTRMALGLWGLGFLLGALRLAKLHCRLLRTRRTSRPASASLGRLADSLGARVILGVRAPSVRISDEIESPLLCGLWNPVILLPSSFECDLTEAEASALLSHELAHFGRHDLRWNLGWRCMQVVCWFHPLVWRAPAAHALACEMEADRWSADLVGSRQDYARCLATLALRTLGLHHPGHTLALEGGSQIARRLEHLALERPPKWSSARSAPALIITVGLLGLTAGCHFQRSTSTSSSAPRGAPASGIESTVDPTEHAFAEVTVVDEAGQPIEGADVLPFGLRVSGHDSASAYGWDPACFGPRVPTPTDAHGVARIRYPVVAIPAEKQRTGALLLTVSHPRYCRAVSQNHPVSGNPKPVRMRRGISVRVTGFFGTDREPVPEISPCLESEHVQRKDWNEESPGTLAFHQLSPGEHLLQFMGRLASGEIVYSESFSFRAEPGKGMSFNLEMKPGLRIEGRLDAKVPRPVKKGRVVVSVRPPEFPALTIPEQIGDLGERFGALQPWHSYRPIAEDGSFVFESVPPGELDLVCHGQGFASANGGTPMNRMPDGSIRGGLVIGVPQAFALHAPVTTIEVITEPTATVRVVATSQDGKPVAGAQVVTSPNMMRLPGGLFAEPERSSEEAFRTLAPLPQLPYEALTGQDGVAVLGDLPSCASELDVNHPDWVVPLDPRMADRWVRFKLTPGLTTELAVKLVPKGTDFRGARR